MHDLLKYFVFMLLSPILSRAFLSRSRNSVLIMGNRKFNSKFGGEKRTPDRPTWKKVSEERHKGSFDLDTLKASEEYKSRIEQREGSVKRKYAVCFGYLGSNYQGLQINPDCKSVEAELEKALFLCGGIEENNFGYMMKTQWSRAARTDRGVHAATQCCAMKLTFPIDKRDQFVEDVNRFLPNDIRVHLLTKVSKGFNAKNDCTKRRYDYLLPTYVLSDNAGLDKLLSDEYSVQGGIKGAGYEGGYLDPALTTALNGDSLRKCRESLLGYRVSEATLDRLREALKCFVGTKFFHNFTSGKTSAEANSQRYIMGFDCESPVVIDGVEYVLLSVVGQSFLLNQIRKMVCMACEVARGVTPVETIATALSKDVKMDIPMVPGEGLYLREIYFDIYTNKLKNLQESEARGAQKRKLESSTGGGSSSSTDPVEITDADAVNKVPRSEDQVTEETIAVPEVPKSENADDKEPEEDGGIFREDLDWCTNPDSSELIKKYSYEAIHPHIREKERNDLPFMFYLDYLRVCPHSYSPKQ